MRHARQHAQQHAQTRTHERRRSLAHEAARLMAEGGGLSEFVKVEDLERMRNSLDFLGPEQSDEEAFDIF